VFQLDWLPTATTIDQVQLRISTKVNHGYLKVEYNLNGEVIGAQEWSTLELPDQVKNVTYTVTPHVVRGRNQLVISASGLQGISWRTAYITVDLLVTYSGSDPTTTKPAEKTDWLQWLQENTGTALVIILALGLLGYAISKISSIKRALGQYS
jgi:hypothetical protein